MGSENLTRLLLFSWFHLRSKLGSPSLVKHFSYKDIKKATDRFKRIIHNSPEGDSYKAVFQNGLVATVKEVKAFDEDDDSFYREVELLGCLNHRHIVALCGFSTGYRRFLVFENSEDTSLMEHLSDPLKTPLNWRTRLQIANGIAAALEYLHFFCDPPVYLVSLSSRTIVLDENLIPKISDVGFLGSARNHEALPTSSCCSEGCTKKECKNIIFQLGLLILELITGQSSETGSIDLVQWVQETNFPRSMHKMIDPDLGNNYDPGELVGLLKVARLCTRSVDKARIHTPRILWYLQKKVTVAPRWIPHCLSHQRFERRNTQLSLTTVAEHTGAAGVIYRNSSGAERYLISQLQKCNH